MPDAVEKEYAYRGAVEAIRNGIAGLVIAFPIFLFVSTLIGRAVAREPEKRGSGVRKWLTYVTLFVAALVIIGDLTFLLQRLLSGELPARVLWKTLVVLAIAGTVFGHYLADLRGEEGEGAVPQRRSPWLAWAVTGVVALTVVAGLVAAGSPRQARLRALDGERVAEPAIASGSSSSQRGRAAAAAGDARRAGRAAGRAAARVVPGPRDRTSPTATAWWTRSPSSCAPRSRRRTRRPRPAGTARRSSGGIRGAGTASPSRSGRRGRGRGSGPRAGVTPVTGWCALWRELCEAQVRARRADARADPADPWRHRARAFAAGVARRWSTPDSSRATVAAWLDAHPGSSVLDVGAGTGAWAAFLSAARARITAVEPSPAMADGPARDAGRLRRGQRDGGAAAVAGRGDRAARRRPLRPRDVRRRRLRRLRPRAGAGDAPARLPAVARARPGRGDGRGGPPRPGTSPRQPELPGRLQRPARAGHLPRRGDGGGDLGAVEPREPRGGPGRGEAPPRSARGGRARRVPRRPARAPAHARRTAGYVWPRATRSALVHWDVERYRTDDA